MIELSELRDAAQKAFPADALRSPRDAAWALCAEMGWLMIDLAEDMGGLGLPVDAAATILFEMGRVLGTAPLIPQLMTIRAVAAAPGLADQAGWLERLTMGDYAPVHLAHGQVTVSDAADGGIVLEGSLPCVPEADMASHVLMTEGGVHALVALDAPGVTISETPMWDETRRMFEVRFASVAVDASLVLARGDACAPIMADLVSFAQLALAADSLGAANACLDMTVEYLKMRRQFDRPLAMFQALKHRCADLKTRIAGAEALLWSRAADEAITLTDLGGLKALANEVYMLVAEEAIQLHGGIGLTEEHNCHLFLKRAMLNSQLAGSTDFWQEMAGRAALERYAPAA